MNSDEPEQFTRPDMIWLPLTEDQMRQLAAGSMIRIKVPADPDEPASRPVLLWIRPPGYVHPDRQVAPEQE